MNDGIGLKATFKFIAKLLFINGSIVNPVTIGSLKLWGYIPFLLIVVFISVPIGVNLLKKINEFRNKDNKIISVISDLSLIIILVLSLMFLIGGTYNPFIYFRF
jgi:Na+/glutamate symporter